MHQSRKHLRATGHHRRSSESIDIEFVGFLVLIVCIIFKLIDLADEVSRQRMREAGREAELEHVTVLLTRLARIVTAAAGLIVVRV